MLMKQVVLTLFVFMVLASSEGRIAWYGEREFENSVTSLEQEGYTVKYIDTIDEKTLSLYDVLVICFTEPTDDQKETILTFVEEGGGLLLIYNVMTYGSIDDAFSDYGLEKTAAVEGSFIFPFLPQDKIEELKKRVAFSQKGKGRAVAVGYDPLSYQTVSLLIDEGRIFSFGLDWLCQEWHVEQTQKALARRRIVFLVPLVILAAAVVGGYYVYRKKKTKPAKPTKPKESVKPEESKKQEQIRELKAKFVYGELSRDEYQRKVEELERSAK